LLDPPPPDDPNVTPSESKRLQLALDDDVTAKDDLLFVTWDDKTRIVTVAGFESDAPPRVAELKRGLPVSATAIQYQRVTLVATPHVTLRPAVQITGLSDPMKKALPESVLEFPERHPSHQSVLYVLKDVDFAVLQLPWESIPGSGADRADFTAVVASTPLRPFTLPRPRNPALSWEYWDGTAWRRIPEIVDDTADLVKSGPVRFCVPTTMQPTDVVGRMNHWIRARLVGGDYGQESVTIVRKPDPKKPEITTETIVRSTDSIHAPLVYSLSVTYSLCCPIVPDVVLTADGGAIRDQTQASRSDAAIVEHFVPLSAMLARFGGSGDTTAFGVETGGAKPPPSPPECVDCVTGTPWTPNATGTAATSGDDGGRALYLGFDAKLEGGPIKILFLLDEGDHEDAYPLRVDALVGNRFEPIVAQDGTRGLNESGILALTLAEPPQLTSLFGSGPQYWLRLRPNRLFDSTKWRPLIRAVYLNASWATAAETQAPELLGSSDGSPGQRVTLARPPVLADSLELRVREPLGDEDVEELRRADPDTVLDAVDARPGPWVLWRPGEAVNAEPGDRVYALDDVTGDITFGDGVNGKIPPIGRDAILAVHYERGGGAAANAVTAWSQLNLVTPVAGIERVIVPDGAAGGSDPQDADTTRRFAPANLALRDRALRLADYELLALQFSPAIAQARALPTQGGLALVVVMCGREPRPSKAVVRELHRYLLSKSLPMLAAPDALQVRGPDVVDVRVSLALRVATLDDTASVAPTVVARIRAFLDPATGGHDGTGWRLGAVPAKDDVAAELVDIRRLEGVDDVSLAPIDPKNDLARLRRTELVRLVPDGVRLGFAVSDTEAVA
jgi:hypothetical protein